MAQVRYVEARQIAYPHKRAKVAGPFEDWTEAREAKDRLAPLYPGCVVKDVLETVNMKKLAELLGGPKIEERTTPWKP